FEECEREVRGSLVYRAFCRIGCESVPDDKTLIRLAPALGPDVLQRIVERLVRLARQRRVVRGLRLRVDTTVVETNIHYPTDSSLLADGVRVITRTVQKLGQVVGKKLRLRDRTRSVGRRVFAIVQKSRRVGEAAQADVKRLYRRLMGITRAVVREAHQAVRQAVRRSRNLKPAARERVPGLREQVRHQQLFGRPPRLVVADAGFASAANERAAIERGVARVALPGRGRLSASRRAHQRQRWFRRALRWRTGSEGRISVVKRRHGLRRCRYRGPAGVQRWVGLGIIASNLHALGRAAVAKT